MVHLLTSSSSSSTSSSSSGSSTTTSSRCRRSRSRPSYDSQTPVSLVVVLVFSPFLSLQKIGEGAMA